MTRKESKRLLGRVSQMGEQEAQPESSSTARKKTRPRLEDAPHGSRGDFFKVTINLSPEVYELFSAEIAKRKKAGRTGGTVSGIIRELALRYLGKNATEE
jgi:hypothetical protein